MSYRTFAAAVTAALTCCAWAASAQAIGETKTDTLFHLSVEHEWDGPPACNPRSGGASKPWDPPSGWVVISTEKRNESANNGRVNFDRESGGPSYPGIASVTNQFDSLLKLARVTKNEQASKEIESIKQAWLQAREGVSTSNHMVASVWAGAHGGCFDRKRGWAGADFVVTLRHVGDDAELGEVIRSLNEKYFPNI